jgi:hypothetical protein
MCQLSLSSNLSSGQRTLLCTEFQHNMHYVLTYSQSVHNEQTSMLDLLHVISIHIMCHSFAMAQLFQRSVQDVPPFISCWPAHIISTMYADNVMLSLMGALVPAPSAAIAVTKDRHTGLLFLSRTSSTHIAFCWIAIDCLLSSSFLHLTALPLNCPEDIFIHGSSVTFFNSLTAM